MIHQQDRANLYRHFDRKIALTFGVLIAFLLTTIVLSVGFFYRNHMENQQNQLSSMMTQMIATAVNRISFSGKYHARILLENLVKNQKDIAEISVTDTQGRILSSSNPQANDQYLQGTLLQLAQEVLQTQKQRIFNAQDASNPIRYILLPYHSGYTNNLSGVILVGISEKAQQQAFEQTLLLASFLLVSLSLLGIFFTRRISRRYGQPVMDLATELSATLKAVPDLLFEVDTQGRYLRFNSEHPNNLVKNAEEILGKRFDEVLPPEAAQTLHEAMGKAQQQGFASGYVVKLIIQGEERWFENGFTLKKSAQGEESFVILSRDITERKRQEDQLRIASVAFNSQQSMMITDHNAVILKVNQAFCQLTGYAVQEVIGQKLNILRSDRQDADFYARMWRDILANGHWEGEVWDHKKNGEVYPNWLNITAVYDTQGHITNFVVTITDISIRKAAENEIKFLAYYDSLTKLPNRRLFMDRLEHTIHTTLRLKLWGALLYIDLDNFKLLNDTQGHNKGDLLLQSVAQRLSQSVRKEDTVARLGGDEFIVLLENLGHHPEEAVRHAEALGEKILQHLSTTHHLDGFETTVTSSIGIALFGGEYIEVEELLKHADLAMYQAKSQGRNTLRFFDPEMQKTVNLRAALEIEMRKGIEQQEFALFYQPQIHVDGKLVGAEVLLRWLHPQKGMISPLSFIPLAEETRLIIPLGYWVLHQACLRLAQWKHQPQCAHLKLAVNVSGMQFYEADFVHRLLRIVLETGAPACQLKLEITESLLIDHIEEVIDKMNELKKLGFEFSLDDFGTGYSSLSYLKRLPISQLKIDQSFVRDLLTDANDASIAQTIVTLGTSLKLDVIAEGVETEDHFQQLKSYGCQNFQGYYFAKPLQESDFMQFIQQKAPQDDPAMH